MITTSATLRATALPKTAAAENARAGRRFAQALQASAAASRPAIATSVAPLRGLLALQAVAAEALPTGARRLERGRRLLSLLDDLQGCLLREAAPGAICRQLARLLEERPDAAEDARLDAILAEIELRAAVVVAQHGSEAKLAGAAGGCPAELATP